MAGLCSRIFCDSVVFDIAKMGWVCVLDIDNAVVIGVQLCPAFELE